MNSDFKLSGQKLLSDSIFTQSSTIQSQKKTSQLYNRGITSFDQIRNTESLEVINKVVKLNSSISSHRNYSNYNNNFIEIKKNINHISTNSSLTPKDFYQSFNNSPLVETIKQRLNIQGEFRFEEHIVIRSSQANFVKLDSLLANDSLQFSKEEILEKLSFVRKRERVQELAETQQTHSASMQERVEGENGQRQPLVNGEVPFNNMADDFNEYEMIALRDLPEDVQEEFVNAIQIFVQAYIAFRLNLENGIDKKEDSEKSKSQQVLNKSINTYLDRYHPESVDQGNNGPHQYEDEDLLLNLSPQIILANLRKAQAELKREEAKLEREEQKRQSIKEHELKKSIIKEEIQKQELKRHLGS